jgi:hypothetical protein
MDVSLPEDVQARLREQAGRAVIWAFAAICPVMWVAVIAAGSLGTVYLDKDQTLRVTGKGRDTTRSERGVMEGSYLVDLYGRYGFVRWRHVEPLMNI